MEVGGIEPHTRVVAQAVTPYCDHIVTVLLDLSEKQPKNKSRFEIIILGSCRTIVYTKYLELI